MMRIFLCVLAIALDLAAQTKVPKIWDDKALEDWATPIAALGVRPGQFTSEEYYSAPVENLKTYPVYRPDREPPGYWEWLQKQKPQPLVESSEMRTREDWIKAGQLAFQTLDDPAFRIDNPKSIEAVRTLASYDGVWTMRDGTLFVFRWVVTEHGVQLGATGCIACHGRPHADGTVDWGAPFGQLATGSIRYNPTLPPRTGTLAPFIGDSRRTAFWRNYTVPWAPDPRIEQLRDMTDEAFLPALPRFGFPFTSQSVFPRTHGSPFHMTKIPDLRNIGYSHYIDATGTHKLRGPEDIGRYAAFITGADPMEFGKYRILTPEQRQVRYHYADEVLYALGMYLMSLEPPRNPDVAPATLVTRGREVFTRETCVRCHVSPNYTSGKLTVAEGFTPPRNHPNQSDIVNISVGTDPGLAMKTRKGTGFYKIPSLRGVWYRPVLLHDGSVASLEEMFDPDRLKPDHVPGGWKGPGVTKRAIPGHPFGLGLNAEDKKALLAFLRSL
jgi:mono/diheme cytochrome c family protein